MLARGAWIALGLLVIALVWQGAIFFFRIPPYILPSLSDIAGAIVRDFPALMQGLRATLFVAGAGFAAGTAIALALVLVIILVPAFERGLMPVLVAINSVPIVAYAPVSLVVLGIGPASKIAMVLLGAGFTVFINALQGVKAVDQGAVNMLRSFGAGPLRVAWLLKLPGALPAIITGLRIAVVRSMLIAIVAEMLGSHEGLGRIIYESTQQIDFLRVWAAIAVASIASMLLYGWIVWIDQKLVWWK
ncbi:MAG: ABC transporter permease subunit [Betaproteobacteria bacterium]